MKKSIKKTKNRAGSEALTDLVESHIRDIVEQRPRKTKSLKNLPKRKSERAMRPSELIAPTNHLAKLLTPAKNRKLTVKSRNKGRGNPGGPSDSSSSSSSSDTSSESSSDSDYDSSSSSSSSDHTRHHKHRRSHKKKRKMLLKPDPPESYNGTADVQTFIKFITEAAAYVCDGQVPKKHCNENI